MLSTIFAPSLISFSNLCLGGCQINPPYFLAECCKTRQIRGCLFCSVYGYSRTHFNVKLTTAKIFCHLSKSADISEVETGNFFFRKHCTCSIGYFRALFLLKWSRLLCVYVSVRWCTRFASSFDRTSQQPWQQIGRKLPLASVLSRCYKLHLKTQTLPYLLDILCCYCFGSHICFGSMQCIERIICTVL